MKEIHNIMNRNNYHRMGLYIVPVHGDNKDINELKQFFCHTVFIESIKKLMVECCECIDKILRYKNEFHKNTKISFFSGELFSSFISLCENIMTNKKKIKYQFKSDDDLKKVLFDTTYYLEHKTVPLSESLLK